MKINKSFKAFINLKSLEFKVLIIYFVIRYISGHKDKRYKDLI
jgi:hypothetical protein